MSLVEDHLYLAEYIYGKLLSTYGSARVSYLREDLLQCGRLAVVKASKTYNPEIAGFKSYAFRAAWNEMRRCLAKEGGYFKNIEAVKIVCSESYNDEFPKEITRNYLTYPYDIFVNASSINEAIRILAGHGWSRYKVIKMAKVLKTLPNLKKEYGILPNY